MAVSLHPARPAGRLSFPDLRNHLDAERIYYEVAEHGLVNTALEEARAYNAPPHRTVKTVVLRARGRYVLALIPASESLNMKKARELLGNRDVRLATEAEIERDLGAFEAGALPPFGWRMPAPELFDRRLLDPGWVVVNGGDRRHSLRVSPLAIIRTCPVRVVDVCED
jgi:prolyl-tRNA editing enzyme YbaK/EbsC (Cys-tRNA(Pro) deacylase)